MEALEKTITNTNLITILLVLLLCCICFLKFLDAKKLKLYVFAAFDKDFIEYEKEESNISLNPFYIILFIFSVAVLALISSNLLLNLPETKRDFLSLFSILFISISFYLLVKRALEYLLSYIFLIEEEVHFFLVSKSTSLYKTCFYLFICFILVEYTVLNSVFLQYSTLLFFALRLLFHLTNNKKLIFSKLFYFILYLCALEIAPLFILFKLMF